MKGRGDVDDALVRTGVARGQRCALPTAAAFAHITTARYDYESKKTEPATAGPERPRWVRFTSATLRRSGSNLDRR